MKKLAIAASSVALAAMPVVGVFATPVTDTITIEVDASCTFTAGGADASYAYNDATNTSGQISPLNGSSSNEHEFTVFCNNNSGYKVSAVATALNQSPSISANFAYVATLPSSGTAGAWNATLSQTGSALTIEQLPTGGAATDVVTRATASGADGESFKAAYTAYVGTATPSGTYSGTIAYTLAAN